MRNDLLKLGLSVCIIVSAVGLVPAGKCDTSPGGNTYSYHGHALTADQAKGFAMFNEAFALIKQHQWQPALEKLKQALELDPDLTAALINAGLCCNQLGQYDQGTVYLKRAVQVDPNSMEAWLNLASGYQSSGRLAESIDSYSEFLKRFPGDSHAPQVKSLMVQLKKESKVQNAAKSREEHSRGGSGAGSTDENTNDYFAYLPPESIIKWTHFPLKVYVPSDEEAQPVDGYRPELGSVLRSAFQEWADKSNGVITYRFIPHREGADIDCQWVGDPSKVKTPAEGGDARIITDVGVGLRHVTITLLTHIATSRDPIISSNTIGTTALHEVGHSLGITGHSPVSDDIMFFSVPQADKPRHLTDRDGNTLNHLYNTVIKQKGRWQSATGDEKLDLNNEAANMMAIGDYASAREKLEQAFKLDPSSVMVRTNLAVCITNVANQYARKGQPEAAIADYNRALELLSDDKDKARKGLVMKNYAAMLYNTKRTAEAKEMEAAANKMLKEAGK